MAHGPEFETRFRVVADPEHNPRLSLGSRVALWALCGLIGTLLPFVFAFGMDLQNKHGGVLLHLTRSGQLYLAAAAISTGALADLIRSVPRPMKPSWIVHIVVVAFLLATVSFLFGDVYATSVNPQAVQKYSVILLIAVAFTSFAAVLRAETS